MQQATDREACAALVYRLYRALDTHDYRELDALFSPDAVVSRLGQVHAGLPNITKVFASRPAELRTRHLIGNLLVEPDAAGGAKGSFTMTVVRATASPQAALPLMVRGPWRVSDVEIGFVAGPAGWRIVRVTTASQFEFDPALAGEAVPA